MTGLKLLAKKARQGEGSEQAVAVVQADQSAVEQEWSRLREILRSWNDDCREWSVDFPDWNFVGNSISPTICASFQPSWATFPKAEVTLILVQSDGKFSVFMEVLTPSYRTGSYQTSMKRKKEGLANASISEVCASMSTAYLQIHGLSLRLSDAGLLTLA